MDRVNWLGVLAALSGALAVAAGAFGAHEAGGQAAELLKSGGHYQLIHAVAALVAIRFEARFSAWAFVVGGGLFGLSLYALALGAPRLVGIVTPVGGALLIAGWICLACSLRTK